MLISTVDFWTVQDDEYVHVSDRLMGYE